METVVKKGDCGWGQGQAVTERSLKSFSIQSCRVKVAAVFKRF